MRLCSKGLAVLAEREDVITALANSPVSSEEPRLLHELLEQQNLFPEIRRVSPALGNNAFITFKHMNNVSQSYF